MWPSIRLMCAGWWRPCRQFRAVVLQLHAVRAWSPRRFTRRSIRLTAVRAWYTSSTAAVEAAGTAAAVDSVAVVTWAAARGQALDGWAARAELAAQVESAAVLRCRPTTRLI